MALENKESNPVEEVSVDPVAETPPKKEKRQMVVNTEILNVRDKAEGEVVSRVRKNDVLTVDSVKGDWAKISKPVEGYCMVQYLK